MENAVGARPEDLPEDCEECPCPKTWCERHGKGRECYEYHAHHSPKNPLPFCLREEDSRGKAAEGPPPRTQPE
jgi:hypothetical protein